MDVFYHCIKAAINECNKTGLNLTRDISRVKVDDSIDINFDLPVNRIAFLYKFGILSIHLFKKCFLDFASDCPEFADAFERMLLSKLVCSLSNGPGTDIIGLQLALKELGKTFNPSTSFKIISKHGSWRNTMNSLIESEESAIPIIGSFKLLQCNITESLSPKAENCLKSADIVLMHDTFAFPNASRIKTFNSLRILLPILKPGAYIFFSDTGNEVPFFELLNSYGTSIYGPRIVQVDNLPFNDIVAEQIGQEPVHCGKACFGVWQKNIATKNIMADSMSVVNVITATNNSDKVIENVPAASNSMKMQLENKTLDFVNEMRATRNFREDASCKNNTPLVNVIPAMKKQNSSCKNNTTPQLHISTNNLPASIVVTKPDVKSKEKNASCSFTSKTNNTAQTDLAAKHNATHPEANCTEDIKTLINSLNILVSKLENFLSSEIAGRNTNPFTCCKHTPMCHNQSFNFCHCCRNVRSCSSYCEHCHTKYVCPNANQSCNCHE